MMVSELADKNPQGLRGNRKAPYEEQDTLKIFGEFDEEIGYIFGDGAFYYDEASNLRDALGWYIATKIGDKDIPSEFNLDAYCAEMLEAIRANGVSFHTYLFMFMESLYRALHETIDEERNPTWFFTIGRYIWRAATRELGINHQGYRIDTPLPMWKIPTF